MKLQEIENQQGRNRGSYVRGVNIGLCGIRERSKGVGRKRQRGVSRGNRSLGATVGEELHGRPGWRKDWQRTWYKELNTECLKNIEYIFFFKISKLITSFNCIYFPSFMKWQRNLSMPSFPEGQDQLETNSVTSVVTGLAWISLLNTKRGHLSAGLYGNCFL